MNADSVESNQNYNDTARIIKLQYLLYNILNQIPENIMGYLLFFKIYYSLILYNLSIQIEYRNRYINKSSINFVNITNANKDDTLNPIINNIQTHITNMITNIRTLQSNNLTSTSNDYLLDKFRYKDKITNLNTVKDEYLDKQNNLNRTIKEYNDSIKTYNRIKLYATIIIIVLIILVIGIILMSILPLFNADTKKMIFLIALIVVITTTVIYYNQFKYVNLYEAFANTIVGNEIVCSGNTATLASVSTADSTQKQNYGDVPNALVTIISNYNTELKKIINSVQSSLNIVGNRVFTETGNAYLNDIFMQKRELIKANKLQQSRLYELIYLTKRDITYIFNIILILLLFIIILLSALVSYSTAPQYFMQIVIMTVILTVILLTYFIIVVVQPTRRDYSKYYWANYKPSTEVMGKL
jgi:hypothetical protein